jgi:hypothetical protein
MSKSGIFSSFPSPYNITTSLFRINDIFLVEQKSYLYKIAVLTIKLSPSFRDEFFLPLPARILRQVFI